jgi:hypothetical protein
MTNSEKQNSLSILPSYFFNFQLFDETDIFVVSPIHFCIMTAFQSNPAFDWSGRRRLLREKRCW